MKTIVIVGANGFLGRVLSRYFLENGWNVVGIARDPDGIVDGVEFVYWDGKKLGAWQEALEWVDVLVNLAGRSVNCRYGRRNRASIFDSRVRTTELLGKAVQGCQNPPKVWLNASTATIYRHAEDRAQGEASGEFGSGFSVEVARAWERAFRAVDCGKTRKLTLRTAMVFGEEAGTVWTVLQGLARRGLGGKMGGGRQMVSWISDRDFARAVDWLIGNEAAEGVYNVCSPQPLTNKELMKEVRASVAMQFGMPANRWMLEIGAFVLRTETELVLKSRWVVPDRLISEGFKFSHEGIDSFKEGLAG
ncbi:TIGR01777 family oxidoreductase [Rubritalea tangerina]|uniref:TIGR01777 family oxidoreductase n=1 Tax=Rubritalea tangerina TaxID=430798 RepID=A0ABW4Z6J2_9BACT